MDRDAVPFVYICDDYKIINMEVKMKRIDLKRGDYFEVKSRVTGRIVTVTGLCIDEDEILEYEIKGEGWWNVNRFEKVEQRVTFDEFYLLEQRVERLETILAGLRLYELKKDLEIF